jgi:hypothetical protein
MMRIIRLSLLAAATTALVACGSGPKLGGGKEGAAKALFETSQASNKGLQRATPQALPIQELASRAAADGLGEITLDCAQGGKFTLRIDFSALLQDGFESGKFNYKIEFDDCNEDGANELNGELAVEVSAVAGGSSAEISLKFKGKVEINGEVDDYIDVDVTEVVSAVGLGQSAGSVTVKLTGTIKTSEATHTYDGTPISVSVEGSLPRADEGKP